MRAKGGCKRYILLNFFFFLFLSFKGVSIVGNWDGIIFFLLFFGYLRRCVGERVSNLYFFSLSKVMVKGFNGL